jgi:transposase-like protein
MPWRTSTVETERARFVLEAELSDLSHAELCRRFNISRPTGYKWIRRYRTEGLDGLRSRSHRPHSCAHATSPAAGEPARSARSSSTIPRSTRRPASTRSIVS